MEKKDFKKYWANFFKKINFKKKPHLGYFFDCGSFYLDIYVFTRWGSEYYINIDFLIKALYTEEEIETGNPNFVCALEFFKGGLDTIQIEELTLGELENIGNSFEKKLEFIQAKGLNYFKELIIPKANQHVHPKAVEYLKSIHIL